MLIVPYDDRDKIYSSFFFVFQDYLFDKFEQ